MAKYLSLDEWDSDGYEKVVINDFDPNYIFEYPISAFEIANELKGEIVALHYSSDYILSEDSIDNCEYLGYGIIKDGEVL